jgi:hypothetical protein
MSMKLSTCILCRLHCNCPSICLILPRFLCLSVHVSVVLCILKRRILSCSRHCLYDFPYRNRTGLPKFYPRGHYGHSVVSHHVVKRLNTGPLCSQLTGHNVTKSSVGKKLNTCWLAIISPFIKRLMHVKRYYSTVIVNIV